MAVRAARLLVALVVGILRHMSYEDESTEDPRTVALEDPAEGTAELDTEAAEPDVVRTDTHVITLVDAGAWHLAHPLDCPDLDECPVTEAASRISRAMCATGGRWTCGVSGASLVLLERIGD